MLTYFALLVPPKEARRSLDSTLALNFSTAILPPRRKSSDVVHHRAAQRVAVAGGIHGVQVILTEVGKMYYSGSHPDAIGVSTTSKV